MTRLLMPETKSAVTDKESLSMAIRVRNLSKVFHVYRRPLDMALELLTRKKRHSDFLALDQISFEARRGEVLGFIGKNGAGKSTLLRILAGTLDKTSGEIEINGRVSAILELGTGFHPYLTGRENVRLGGLCMGMSVAEIGSKMDSIIDFSELEEFIDQPFRTYSSGMQARLTFAVATAGNPDILIVDESLSVGDARFQSKCFARIRQFRENGGTIILVSHADNVITQFCDRALLIEHGKVMLQDEPKKVIAAYYDLIYGKRDAQAVIASRASGHTLPALKASADLHAKSDPSSREVLREWAIRQIDPLKISEPPAQAVTRNGSQENAEILDCCILDELGIRTTRLESGGSYRFQTHILFYRDMTKPEFSFAIRNPQGVWVFATDTRWVSESLHLENVKAGSLMRAYMDVKLWLTNGDYFLGGSVFQWRGNGEPQIEDYLIDVIHFNIAMHPELYHNSVVNLEHRFGFDWLKKS